MTTELIRISEFIFNSFLHIWPYLLITIPLAVAVNLSGVSKYINRAFTRGPIIAVFLATLVGAFSPFCSCGVIPVIAALLIGGVPLAPVMSFWIASPSMDPEIFFLSVGMIGWDLAVWRLAATLVLSLTAGLATHAFVSSGWVGQNILTNQNTTRPNRLRLWVSQGVVYLRRQLISPSLAFVFGKRSEATVPCCDTSAVSLQPLTTIQKIEQHQNAENRTTFTAGGAEKPERFMNKLLQESAKATIMVVKFMALAFFLEALIILYIPTEWIAGLLGRGSSFPILLAAFMGIPVYTSSLSALPMVSGLLEQGMTSGAALAFLIAGPTTTLPAMAAVYSLVNRKIFGLYLAFALLGAIAAGYINSILG